MSDRIQAWFEKIVRGLAKQSWLRATSPGDRSRCVYRTSNGMCCAIGHIIPDDAPCIRTNYTANFLRHAGRLKDLGLGDISSGEMLFLEDAQNSHDNHEMPERVKENFSRLGERLNLTWPIDVPHE